MKTFKNFYHHVLSCLYLPNTQKLLKLLVLCCIFGLSTHALANDLLSGTEANLVDTLNGTGKKYLYIAEGIVSLLIYIKTKNVIALIGIMVVAIFFNVMLKIAGV